MPHGGQIERGGGHWLELSAEPAMKHVTESTDPMLCRAFAASSKPVTESTDPTLCRVFAASSKPHSNSLQQ